MVRNLLRKFNIDWKSHFEVSQKFLRLTSTHRLSFVTQWQPWNTLLFLITTPTDQGCVKTRWSKPETRRKVHSVETQIHIDSKGKVAHGSWIIITIVSSATVLKYAGWRPCAPDTWPFEHRINRRRQAAEDYHCAKFQVIPIGGFRFILLTYTHPTYIHTHTHGWQSDRYIRAAVLRCRRG